MGLPGFGLVGDPKLPSHSPALLVPPLSFNVHVVWDFKQIICSFYGKSTGCGVSRATLRLGALVAGEAGKLMGFQDG